MAYSDHLANRAPTARAQLSRTLVIAVTTLLPLMAGFAVAECNPQPAAASRWQLALHDGVSWLITPCGYPFFSIGVNTLSDTSSPPMHWNRETHSWFAPYRTPDSWARRAAAQIRAWGFNTAGAFSSANVPLPSLPELDLGWRAAFHWSDPFDPAMAQRMTTMAKEAVGYFRAGAYPIGYFYDNEIGWWNGELFGFYFGKPRTNYTKQKLVALISRDYDGDWRSFVHDFAVTPGLASFQALLEKCGVRVRLRPGGNGMRVVRDWTRIVAQHYYEVATHALHVADPKALVFSDRLPNYYDPDAIRAMAPFVDAVATNYNPDSPDGWIAHYYFDGLRQLTGNKPILVSEWYFAATENRTGNLNNGRLMVVRTQAERARGAVSAARHFAMQPGIIGIDWFQYYDEPKGGRAQDHEDYDFGLVDREGRPYAQLVSALTTANRSLAAIHQSAAESPIARAPATIAIPEASLNARAASLAQWPKDKALVKGFSAPSADVVFGDFFLAWNPQGLHLATISMDHYDPDLLGFDGAFPRTEAFRIDFGVDTGNSAQRFAFFAIPPQPSKRNESIRIEVCRMNRGACEAVPAVETASVIADRSRIAFQAVLPWKTLGMPGPPPGGHLRVQLAASTFYRSHWMSLGGGTPAEAMENLASWKPATLTGGPHITAGAN